MKRRGALFVLGAGLLAPRHVLAQARHYRIGYLSRESAQELKRYLEIQRKALRDLGYVEGKNLTVEYRWAEGKYDRLPALAAELVRLKVDVILAQTTLESVAAKKATTTIPIVMVTVGDPVATGLVASLARPGGNAT